MRPRATAATLALSVGPLPTRPGQYALRNRLLVYASELQRRRVALREPSFGRGCRGAGLVVGAILFEADSERIGLETGWSDSDESVWA